MRTFVTVLALMALVLAAVDAVKADVVILKSGELFNAEQSWKENDRVCFDSNGRPVCVDENQVERLIRTTEAENVGPRPNRQSFPRSLPKPQAAADSIPSIDVPPIDDAVGYLDLTWGVSPDRIEGLKPAGQDPAYGGIDLYAMQKGKRFGRAQVDQILCGFWEDRLYTVTIWTSNFLDFRDLKSEAFRRFGQGAQKRQDVEKFHWVADGTDRLLSYTVESDTGFLWMRSSRLHRSVKKHFPEE